MLERAHFKFTGTLFFLFSLCDLPLDISIHYLYKKKQKEVMGTLALSVLIFKRTPLKLFQNSVTLISVFIQKV